MTLKVGIFGATGRMGRMLAREVLSDAGCALAGGSVREGSAYMDKSLLEALGLPSDTVLPPTAISTISPEKLLAASDVVIDFTRAEVSVHHAYVAAAMGKPIVIGTTGFNAEQVQMLGDAANHIPIVLAPNTSLGLNLIQAMVEIVAQTLDANKYDIEIVEMHHRHKIDAPSGTALALAEAAAQGRNTNLKAKGIYDRKGKSGPRKRGDIGFAVLRGGDVVGDHSVIFAGDGERVELTHKASDRRIFAQGALVAAKWIVQQQPGRYSMKDVLGF
jgi:4-hydroxy-tetrahydrodipicolinate reductase